MEFEQCKMNLSDWIKQEEADFGENALLYPNTLYLTVLREINQQVNEFRGGSAHLVRLAMNHSVIYCKLSQDERNVVAMILALRSVRAGTKSISN